MATQKNNVDMANEHMQELFLDELRDVLGAEKKLLKGLKKLSQSASSETLKMAFDEHHQQTEQQIERLKEVFSTIDLTAPTKKCKAMEGLSEEADELIESLDEGPVLDAALISASQKVEHYEIAS